MRDKERHMRHVFRVTLKEQTKGKTGLNLNSWNSALDCLFAQYMSGISIDTIAKQLCKDYPA